MAQIEDVNSCEISGEFAFRIDEFSNFSPARSFYPGQQIFVISQPLIIILFRVNETNSFINFVANKRNCCKQLRRIPLI